MRSTSQQPTTVNSQGKDFVQVSTWPAISHSNLQSLIQTCSLSFNDLVFPACPIQTYVVIIVVTNSTVQISFSLTFFCRHMFTKHKIHVYTSGVAIFGPTGTWHMCPGSQQVTQNLKKLKRCILKDIHSASVVSCLVWLWGCTSGEVYLCTLYFTCTPGWVTVGNYSLCCCVCVTSSEC